MAQTGIHLFRLKIIDTCLIDLLTKHILRFRYTELVRKKIFFYRYITLLIILILEVVVKITRVQNFPYTAIVY